MNTIMPIVVSMRPTQWYKNLIVFMPIIFSLDLFNFIYLFKTIIAFLILCLASGCLAAADDLIDKEKDQSNPLRKQRPIAAAAVSINRLEFFLVVVIVGALFSAFFLNTNFGIVVIMYMLLMTAYSLWLKKIFLVDLTALAASFCLLALSGAVVANENISPWILMFSFVFGLLLAVVKLKTESVLLGEHALMHRQIYSEYTKGFLSALIAFLSISIFNMFAVAAVLGDTALKVGDSRLIYTLPIVAFGVFRFLFLVSSDRCKSVEDSILLDIPFVVSMILWFLVTIFLIYV